MNIAGHNIAVCSWSLRPSSMEELIERVRRLELHHVQLALRPLLAMEEEQREAELRRLGDSGLVLTAGMIDFPGENYDTIATIRETGGVVPDREWAERKDLALRAGELAARLDLRHISLHVGAIPRSSDEKYPVMLQRVRQLALAWADFKVDLLLETGQETAGELLQFLNDLGTRSVGVNFDPANVLLYGAGDPLEAVQTLGRHIRHVHAKDAVLSEQPGVMWGREVILGTGQVNLQMLLGAFDAVGYTGPLAIEREAGEQRLEDVAAAIVALRTAAEGQAA